MSSQAKPDAKPTTPQAKPEGAKKVVRRIAVGPERGRADIAGSVVRAILMLIALSLIVNGYYMEPDSAIHHIYQLNSIGTGLILIAIIGVWGAVDALRREPK